jgi:hypothetical protein
MTGGIGIVRIRPSFAHALIALLSVLAVCALARTAGAQQAIYDENRVKAAFLLRFVQFVEWPQDAFAPSGGTLVITVAGADAVHAGLVQLLAERVGQGRAVAVRQLKSADDLAQAHVLFIGAAARSRIEQYLASTGGRPVLVVTDSDNALERGSMINFLTIERRVRFEIGLDSAKRAGLAVSSRLLSIATRIHRGALGYAPLAAAATAPGCADPPCFACTRHAHSLWTPADWMCA